MLECLGLSGLEGPDPGTDGAPFQFVDSEKTGNEEYHFTIGPCSYDL